MPNRAAWRALAAPFALLLAWQTLGLLGAPDSRLLPLPSAIAACAWRMLWSGELPEALGATLGCLGRGFALGALGGLIWGLLMGAVRGLRELFAPLVSVLLAVPLLALLPLLMLWTGAGEVARVAVVAASCFLLVALHATDALRAVPPAYVALAANYGAGRLALLRKVYLPAALPHVFTGVRLALETGYAMTVSSELIVPSAGLGSLILLGWQQSAAEKLWGGVLLAAAVGISLHVGSRHLGSLLIPWQANHRDFGQPNRPGTA